MFCNNCGSNVPDGTAFCPNCGQKVEAGPAPASNGIPAADVYGANPTNPAAPAGNKNNIAVIAAAAVVVLLAVLVLSKLFGGSAKGAVKDYIKAVEKSKGKDILELTIPKQIIKDYCEDVYDDSVKEAGKDISEELEDLWDEVKDNDGKITFTIGKCEDLDKLKKFEDESRFDDLDDFKDELEDIYDDYDKFDAGKVKKAYIYEIKMKMKMDGDTDTEETYVYVYKYKGDWYIYGGLGMLF